jgi:8-oxo-dGTP pyrophosphatase MutT (NUDIX family)
MKDSKKSDYINWIRSKVGKERIFLNCAGGCIFDKSGKLLLQKRSINNDEWGFPGGAMNIGETAEAAAIREIKEETGYNVIVDKLVGVYTGFLETLNNGDKVQPIVFFFKLKIIGGDISIDNDETFDLKFFSKSNLPDLYSELHKVILKDVLAESVAVFR